MGYANFSFTFTRKKVKIAVFLCSVLLLASCADVQKGNQLSTIDKMMTRVDSLAIVVKNNPAPNATSMSDSIKNVEVRFKTYYDADTVDRVLANDINDLKQARKNLAHMEFDHKNFVGGCSELKESLRQLRYDIDNGDGDRKKYDEYIAFEQNKLRTLTTMVKDYEEQKNLSYDRYKRLYKKWNDFSLTLVK